MSPDVAELPAAVSPDTVGEVVAQVWESLFDLPALPADPAEDNRVDVSTSAVVIEGSWNGIVALSCSTPVASAMAATMLDLPADHCDDEDVADALREVVNMIGGNVKSLLDGCSLGLPRTGEIVTGTPLVTHYVDWHGETVTVRVLDHLANPATAPTTTPATEDQP